MMFYFLKKGHHSANEFNVICTRKFLSTFISDGYKSLLQSLSLITDSCRVLEPLVFTVVNLVTLLTIDLFVVWEYIFSKLHHFSNQHLEFLEKGLLAYTSH